MKYLVDFLEAKDITKTEIFSHLKCSTEEAIILRHITKHYVLGLDSSSVNDLLIELFGDKKYEHLNHLDSIKNLLDQL